MTKELSPRDLKSLINKDDRFKRAEALLQNHWESLLLDAHFGMTTITREDISLARHLIDAEVISTVVDLRTFSGIKKFIMTNQSRLSEDVIRALKEPFL